MKSLAIDLYCGLGGWADGLIAEGFTVAGFDIERHDYGKGGYPGHLVLQDATTLHGSQFKNAALIVASPPCQEYSYMAMPWSRAKQIEGALRGLEPFPEGYTGSRTIAELTALFDACFRIQREACEAAGRYIPLIVENVRGAQKWVGRAKANFGSYYLWGDVGMVGKRVVAGVPQFGMSVQPMRESKLAGRSLNPGEGKWRPANGLGFEESDQIAQKRNGSGSWFKIADSKNGGAQRRAEVQAQVDETGTKGGGDWVGSGEDCSLQRRFSGTKQAGISGERNNGKGDKWFQDGAAAHGSKSNSRKAASAQIAKIPFPLAVHIARCFRPVL